jgi:hypothetical protein
VSVPEENAAAITAHIGDASLDWIFNSYQAPPALETPEHLDSQDTAAEDPMDHRERFPSLMPPPPHWSASPQFIQSVFALTKPCVDLPWYDGILPYTAELRPLVFAVALQHSINFIRAWIQPKGNIYKVGITGHPQERFAGKKVAHAYIRSQIPFRYMTILWTAPTSRKELNESSGKMEVELIKVFNAETDPNCINRKGAGGECPGRGSPQFTYVVWS